MVPNAAGRIPLAPPAPAPPRAPRPAVPAPVVGALVAAVDPVCATGAPATEDDPAQATAYIINPLSGRKASFANLFTTHPPTADRVARLREQARQG